MNQTIAIQLITAGGVFFGGCFALIKYMLNATRRQQDTLLKSQDDRQTSLFEFLANQQKLQNEYNALKNGYNERIVTNFSLTVREINDKTILNARETADKLSLLTSSTAEKLAILTKETAKELRIATSEIALKNSQTISESTLKNSQALHEVEERIIDRINKKNE